MKRAFLSLTLSLLLVASVRAQSPYTSSYFPLVNKAELAIADSNYRAALDFYKRAFASVPRGFARDYFNAMACAAATGDGARTIDCIDTLLSLGADPRYLKEQPSLAALLHLTRNKDLEQHLNARVRPDGQRIAMTSLFDSLAKIDQEFRRKEGSYRVYGDTIRKIDSLNIVLIRKIIDSAGFPGERMTGISQPRSNGLPANIVFVHHCQSLSLPKGKGKYNFKSDFIQAVDEGRMDPFDFARLLAMQNDQGFQLGTITAEVYSYGGLTSAYMVNPFTAAAITVIDSIRLSHGLARLEDSYRKMAFALKNPRAKEFAMGNYGSVSYFPLETREEYDNLVKYLRPL